MPYGDDPNVGKISATKFWWPIPKNLSQNYFFRRPEINKYDLFHNAPLCRRILLIRRLNNSSFSEGVSFHGLGEDITPPWHENVALSRWRYKMKKIQNVFWSRIMKCSFLLWTSSLCCNPGTCGHGRAKPHRLSIFCNVREKLEIWIWTKDTWKEIYF